MPMLILLHASTFDHVHFEPVVAALAAAAAAVLLTRRWLARAR